MVAFTGEGSTDEADHVRYDETFFTEFFKNISAQLADDLVRKANLVIIRFCEAEIVHLDFHYLEPDEPVTSKTPYGFQLNGKEISLYEIGKTSIVSADLYGHPIDIEEVFMSITNEFFYSVMGLRTHRILQSIYRKTKDFLVRNYEMGNYQIFIGDYNEVLWVE